jgi:hypothetical protein
MRVKVSRTISLDEVPELASRIAAECKDSLQESACRIIVDTHDVPRTIHTLESVAADIDLLSIKLQDAVNILTGWHQTMYPPSEVEAPDEAADE